jgi:hypothetical protein
VPLGYAIVLGQCFACGRAFTFNPHRVPSIPIDPVTRRPPDMGGDPARARREPICETCFDRANELRVARGEQPVALLPGAYDALDAGEL